MKKIIVNIIAASAGAVVGAAIFRNGIKGNYHALKEMADKHFALYMLMNQWVHIKQEGKSVAEYLNRKGLNSVAIYGMNYIGETLFKELEHSPVCVEYAIDKNAEVICAGCKTVVPEDALPPVDGIIVTPVFYYENIKHMLSEKVDYPILSLGEILFEL